MDDRFHKYSTANLKRRVKADFVYIFRYNFFYLTISQNGISCVYIAIIISRLF